MKKLNLFALSALLFSLTFVSCNSDDEANPSLGNPDVANEQNREEEAVIPMSQLSRDLVITGATKETGTPPAPNGAVDFRIATDLQEAFQQTGFEIRFSSDSDIAGAYIQFQDADSNPMDGYYDVPVSFINGRTATKSVSLKKSPLANARTAEDEDERTINVDFDKALPAGTFCYTICLYDEAQNVSQVEEVCVEVEAWGGNATIVGEWIFDREESSEDEDDDPYTITCDNGQDLPVTEHEDNEREWLFALNEDGSYYEIYDSKYYKLNDSTSRADCVVTYGELKVSKKKYSGHWAFNEREETLTVVDFAFEDLLDSENNEKYEDGSLYFEGVTIEVVNGELVLTETEVEGGITYTEKTIFKRK